MAALFDTILYNPLLNALIGLYHVIPGHDLGLAIILLTLATKVILAYPSFRAIKAQRELQLLQPKLEELKARYKDNKEELGKKLMSFYREHRISPFSSCLPTIVQLPVLIVLYQVFINGLAVDPNTGVMVEKTLRHLYEPLRSVYSSSPLDLTAFGFLNLAATKNIVLAVLAGGLQFVQSRMLMSSRPAVKGNGARDEAMAAGVSKQMTYLFPLFTVYLAYLFPAGLGLYWVTSTLFQIGQQLYLLRRTKTAPPVNESPDSKT